jgi:hypothetical protein
VTGGLVRSELPENQLKRAMVFVFKKYCAGSGQAFQKDASRASTVESKV